MIHVNGQFFRHIEATSARHEISVLSAYAQKPHLNTQCIKGGTRKCPKEGSRQRFLLGDLEVTEGRMNFPGEEIEHSGCNCFSRGELTSVS